MSKRYRIEYKLAKQVGPDVEVVDVGGTEAISEVLARDLEDAKRQIRDALDERLSRIYRIRSINEIESEEPTIRVYLTQYAPVPRDQAWVWKTPPRG